MENSQPARGCRTRSLEPSQCLQRFLASHFWTLTFQSTVFEPSQCLRRFSRPIFGPSFFKVLLSSHRSACGAFWGSIFGPSFLKVPFPSHRSACGAFLDAHFWALSFQSNVFEPCRCLLHLSGAGYFFRSGSIVGCVTISPVIITGFGSGFRQIMIT